MTEQQLLLPGIVQPHEVLEFIRLGVTDWSSGPPPFAGWWETHDPTGARKTTQMRWYFNGHNDLIIGWSYPVYAAEDLGGLQAAFDAGSAPNQDHIMWRGLPAYPAGGYEYAIMIIPNYWNNVIKG